MQIAVRRNTDTNERAEKCRVGVKKPGRKVALRHQVLRSVNIFKKQTEQLCALNNSCFDIAPLVCRYQEWDNIDLPGAAGSERVAVDVIGDSVFANATLGANPASSQFLGAYRLHRLH